MFRRFILYLLKYNFHIIAQQTNIGGKKAVGPKSFVNTVTNYRCSKIETIF